MKEKLLHRKRAAFTVLFTLLLSVAGVTNVFAQSFTVDNLNYNINDDEASVTVTGYVGTSTTGDLVIPENVNYYGTTYSVTVIGENAFYDCGLTGTLTIGNTVHTIGNSAFSECSFTGTLTIPNSVTTIGESAFSSCTGFTGVLTIPENVQYIGKYAFSDCVGFTSLYYNAINCYIEVEEHSEWYGEDEYYWWYEGMWLEGCFSMTVVVIGENVQTIPAFFGYSSFFAGELIIPESVTSVGYHAFDGCGFTGSLNIGNSVTSIESYAFNGCGFTGSLTIGNSVTSIGEYAFSGCGFTGSLTIGNPVTYIGDYAFGGCYGFTELNFNATNANVSSSWLEGGGEVAVSSLTTLNIGENVQRIPDGFVNGCSGIVGSLTIPNSVTYIGSNAFSGCSGFSGTLTIGNSVTQIGSYAFFGASQGFTSFVVWPETPPTLGSNVFISADYGAPVSVPCNTVEAYQNAEGWNMFTNFQNFSPCMWVITADPNLISGGIVSGTGTYEQGSTCTLVANPNEGFSFVNWTEDGAEVSTDVEYVFTVSESRYLVANFQIDNLIGEGTATNSYLPSYSYNRYSLTQQIYTAEEIGQMCVIKNLAFFNTGTTRTRNYDIYLVYTERSAFSSSSDWASVTESDKVFSGDVTMLSNDWTIINFETPFAYNGTSNLVLVVDDNSNYYDYSSMACLVFGTSSSQALYVNSNTNYDPTNPFQYNGTLLTEKNQIALGFSSLDAVVFATVFPVEAGSVSGEGAYQLGETCSLTAIPDSEDYVFENWTENGEVVSTDAQYSFTVMGNRNLVANFLQYRFDIVASAIPEEGGMVTGAGYYLLGQTCTLIATPNENYFFINWTENGQIVSTDAAYSFMVTENRALEANFIDPIGAVHVDYFPDVLNPGSPYVGVTWNSTNTIDATIGDEISTSNEAYMPFYTLYNYSISEALYTAAELAEAGVTTGQMISLSWDAISVTTNQVQNNISIWIANVPDIELAFTSHLAGNMTLVYTGNIGIPSLGWNEFVFNEGSFAWDGHSNVLILCQRNNGLWNGNVNWRSHNPGFIGMTYNYQDSTPYDVTTQTYAVNRSGYRPNIMFKFSYDLGNSIYYKVFRKDCDGNEYTLVADSVSEKMYIDSLWLLQPIGSYQYGVSAIDSSGNESEIVTSNCIERSSYTYQIAATANYEERGTVSGWGEYALGTNCTLTATPIGNNTFTRWTENGVEVSTEANYSFIVTGPRNLVAVFSVSSEDIIFFADNNVKTICVNYWDTDSDGELSYDEAAIVTDLGTVFCNHSEIASFNELQYFTGLTSIGYTAFYECTSLTSIVIPEGVTLIDSYAFYDCYNLVSVNIPDGVVWIGEYAFYVCGLLGELTLPEPLEYVGNYAFFGCDGITTVNYNAVNCQTVGSAAKPAFYDCAFTHLNIGKNVQNIPNFAFKRCFMITDMTVAAVNPPTIYPGTFGMVSRSIPVSVPYGSVDTYRNTQYWEEFFNIIEVYFNDVQILQLSQGWNWISTYIEGEPVELLDMLKTSLGDNALSIEGTEGVIEYIGDGYWFGDEFGIANETMYLIDVVTACTVELQGLPANPSDHEIEINPNDWNWIGYPCNEELLVEVALSGYEPEIGDIIESNTDGVVEYVGVWYGDFDTLKPGWGYMYYSASGESKTLVFQTERSKAKAKSGFFSGKTSKMSIERKVESWD